MKLTSGQMAGIGSLAQAGVGLAQAILTKYPKPDTSAVYTREYSQTMQAENAKFANDQQRRRSGQIQHTAELTIASARARGVRQRLEIGLNQAQAEAMLRVNAAAAGMTGGSIQDALYQTEANASFRGADQRIDENNTISKVISDMYASKSQTMISEDRGPAMDYDAQSYNSSLMGAAMSGIGNLDSNFYKDLGLALETIPTSRDAYRVEQDTMNEFTPNQANENLA